MKITYTEIIRIAFPLVLGQLAWTIVGVVDTAFLGHYSATALAAGGYAGMFFLLLLMLAHGFTRGAQILMAQSVGEGNPHKVSQLFTNTLFFCLLSGVLLAAVVWLTADIFFSFILNDRDTIAGCVTFISWRIAGLPAVFLSSVYFAFYTALGRTVILMYATLLLSALNMALNPVLIFGLYGFPELGIAGSAISSVIAEWVAFVLVVVASRFAVKPGEFSLYCVADIQAVVLRTIGNTSLPLVVQQLLGVGGWFLFFAFIEKMSATDLAVSNIIRQIFSVIGIIVFTLGSATNTIVGQLYGRKALSSVYPAVCKLIKVGFFTTLFLSLVMYFFSPQLMYLFSPDFVIQQATISVLPIILIALLIMSVSNVVLNALISLGDTLLALKIEVWAMSLYILYFFGIFLRPGRSLYLMWTAEWIYWIFILIFVLYYFRKKTADYGKLL